MRCSSYRSIFGVNAKKRIPLIITSVFPDCRQGEHTLCVEMFKTIRSGKTVVCVCQCHNVLQKGGL